MTPFSRWIHLLFVVFSVVQCDFTETKRKEKLDFLKRNTVDGVIHFHNDMFENYVLQTNRPYHLFLFFTTSTKRLNCLHCEKFSPEYTVLAESYYDAHMNQRITATDELDIFFGVIDYSYNNKAYETYGLNTIPHLVYISPNEDPTPLETFPETVTIHEENKYNLYTNNIEAEAVEKFVRQKTGAHFGIERSKLFLLTFIACLVSFFILSTKLIIKNWAKLLKLVRKKKLWMYISFQIYTISVSGMVYCIIRNSPSMQYEQNGRMRLFSPESRSQFVFEGIVIGAYNAIAAIALIVLAEYAIYIKDASRRTMVIGLSLVVFVMAYKLLFAAYKFKNPWYGSHSWI